MKYVDFLDAPIVVNSSEKTLGWFTFENNELKGWKESVKYVLEYVKKNGPYQGILGFSQGGIQYRLNR